MAHSCPAAGRAHWYSCAVHVEVCGHWSNHRGHYWSSTPHGGLPWLLSVSVWDNTLPEPHLDVEVIQQFCIASTGLQIRSGPNNS